MSTIAATLPLAQIPVLATPAVAAGPVGHFVCERYNYQAPEGALLPVLPVWEPPPPIQVDPIEPLPYGSSNNILVARRLAALLNRGDEYERTRPPGVVLTRRIAVSGQFCRVVVSSNLRKRRIYHWYVNGRYAGSSHGNSRVFRCPPGRQINVLARPRRRSSYPAGDRLPVAYSGELTLEWIRSPDEDVACYRVEYRSPPGSGDWVGFGRLTADDRWDYRITTPQLDDDAEYEFRVIPVDTAGNAGTPLELGTERVVRYPNVTAADVTWDPGTTKFTFDEE